MKYVRDGGDKGLGEWRRIKYPAILKRIRAMYMKEDLVEESEPRGGSEEELHDPEAPEAG